MPSGSVSAMHTTQEPRGYIAERIPSSQTTMPPLNAYAESPPPINAVMIGPPRAASLNCFQEKTLWWHTSEHAVMAPSCRLVVSARRVTVAVGMPSEPLDASKEARREY